MHWILASREGCDRVGHLLEVEELRVSFFTNRGEVKAVDGVSFCVDVGEVVGIVGESGCGKSVSQLSVLQLVQTPPGRVMGGKAVFEGSDLLSCEASSQEIRAIRGAGIAMIFQEPMTSLNPVRTVGSQLIEVIRCHSGLRRRAARVRAIDALAEVGIPEAESRMRNYPFQMSGGMRQRVMIATAVACDSKLIVADEPTTALDVTTQAQVMELLVRLVRERSKAMILITHNFGLVSRYADRVYVMYAGKVVESGTAEEVLTTPRHPYTVGLMRCVPNLEDSAQKGLVPIPGRPPNLSGLPDRCTFLTRCPYAEEECERRGFPGLRDAGSSSHRAACHVEIAGGRAP